MTKNKTEPIKTIDLFRDFEEDTADFTAAFEKMKDADAKLAFPLYRVFIDNKKNTVVLVNYDETDEETGKPVKEIIKVSAEDKFDAYTGYCVALFKHITRISSSRFERKYSKLFNTPHAYEEIACEYISRLGITREVFTKWLANKTAPYDIEAVAGYRGPRLMHIKGDDANHQTDNVAKAYFHRTRSKDTSKPADPKCNCDSCTELTDHDIEIVAEFISDQIIKIIEGC